MPSWSVELAAGVIVPIIFVAIRLLAEPVTADRAPYALNFVAVLLATVIAGWRSGLLALVVGQAFTSYALVEPQWSWAIDGRERVWGLIFATFAQALLLLVVALYQREVDKGVAERERRLELQEHARREIDHRLRNNFQTVLALIHLQRQRSDDAGVKDALHQVSERIKAIASVTERLAIRGDDLATVSLRDHLCDLCEQLEHGLADGISVHCEIADIPASAVDATYLGLIVTELVTNALKHAFAEARSGWVRIEGEASTEAFVLVVRDNGAGMKRGRSKAGSGLGQKLVQAFVKELDGTHELSSSAEGTTHRIIIPRLAVPRIGDRNGPSAVPGLAFGGSPA